MATKLKLPEVRLSFNSLFEAEQYKGAGAFRYRAVFLLPKGSKVVSEIEAAIITEAKMMWPDKWQQMLASFKGQNNKFCISDGDLTDTDGHGGMVVLAANRKAEQGRPLVIDRNKAPLTQADGKPYSGCYVNASVEIWAQDGANKGIRCALLGVQFVKDGDSFAGGRSIDADEFEDLSPAMSGNVQPIHTGTDSVALF